MIETAIWSRKTAIGKMRTICMRQNSYTCYSKSQCKTLCTFSKPMGSKSFPSTKFYSPGDCITKHGSICQITRYKKGGNYYHKWSNYNPNPKKSRKRAANIYPSVRVW